MVLQVHEENLMVNLADLSGLKIVEGRILNCIAEAEKPLSLEELFQALETTYKKNYRSGLDRDTFNCALARTGSHGWIETRELSMLPEGQRAYSHLMANKGSWAEKFFRPSNSPNVSVVSEELDTESHTVHKAVAGLNLNPATW
jgi:hypothetical protein